VQNLAFVNKYVAVRGECSLGETTQSATTIAEGCMHMVCVSNCKDASKSVIAVSLE
jgi:hypothetical protein